MRISDWSSDVCSSDLMVACPNDPEALQEELEQAMATVGMNVDIEIGADPGRPAVSTHAVVVLGSPVNARAMRSVARELAKQGANIDSIRGVADYPVTGLELSVSAADTADGDAQLRTGLAEVAARSEEHTSELPPLMRISYDVFCLNNQKT